MFKITKSKKRIIGTNYDKSRIIMNRVLTYICRSCKIFVTIRRCVQRKIEISVTYSLMCLHGGGGKMYEFSYNGYAGKITYAFSV